MHKTRSALPSTVVQVSIEIYCFSRTICIYNECSAACSMKLIKNHKNKLHHHHRLSKPPRPFSPQSISFIILCFLFSTMRDSAVYIFCTIFHVLDSRALSLIIIVWQSPRKYLMNWHRRDYKSVIAWLVFEKNGEMITWWWQAFVTFISRFISRIAEIGVKFIVDIFTRFRRE